MGRVSGAWINVQIELGINNIHGDAYETNSNSAMEEFRAVFTVGQKLP